MKVELNRSGVKELLNSPELEKGLEEIASGIKFKCGKGYAYDTKRMGTRVIASVYTSTDEAKKDNEQNNTILKNLK